MKRACTRATAWAALIGLAAMTACGSSEKTGPTPPAENISENNTNKGPGLDKKLEEAKQLELRGDYVAAERLLLDVKESNPDFKVNENSDQTVSTRLENYERLTQSQRDIESLEGDSPELLATYHTELADELRNRDFSFWAQSKSQYEKALELNPDNFKANFGLAKLYFQAGYPERAIQSFTRAVELDGSRNDEKAEAHFQLAFMHNTADVPGAQPDLALKNARLAVEYAGNDALEYRRLLANLLLDADQVPEAIKVAEDIVSREGATDGDKRRVERFQKIADGAGDKGGEDTPSEPTPGEEPKPEDPPPAEPKPEEPKPEEPGPEEPKPEEPKPEEPKPEEPKPAEPKPTEPSEPKPEEPKPAEPAPGDAPKEPAPEEPSEPGGDEPDEPGGDDDSPGDDG